MKKNSPALFLALMACLGTALPLQAQERTASGPLQTEASWAALRILVNKAQGDANLNKIDINAIKNCASQGKLYAGSGCRDAIIPGDPNLAEVLKCGSQGKVYATGSGCIETAGSNRWVADYVPISSKASISLSVLNQELSNAGIGRCSTNTPLSRKCSAVGQRCVVVTETSRTCGGTKSEHTCTDHTPSFFACN